MKLALLFIVLTYYEVHCRLYAYIVNMNISSNNPEVVEVKFQYEKFKFNITAVAKKPINNVTVSNVFQLSNFIMTIFNSDTF